MFASVKSNLGNLIQLVALPVLPDVELKLPTTPHFPQNSLPAERFTLPFLIIISGD